MGQAQQKRRTVLIVEDDAELRSLTAALFEDEQVGTIECESAEAALGTLLIGGREVAMIFADMHLRGVMDGIDLAREVKMRWPLLPVILTSGHPRERVGVLPPGVAYLPMGFTFICGTSSGGQFQIKRKARRDRMRAKLKEIEEMRQRRHHSGSRALWACLAQARRPSPMGWPARVQTRIPEYRLRLR
jgi:CheY-like chemotaxis protein